MICFYYFQWFTHLLQQVSYMLQQTTYLVQHIRDLFLLFSMVYSSVVIGRLYIAIDNIPGTIDVWSVGTVILLLNMLDILLSFFNDALINYNLFYVPVIFRLYVSEKNKN